MPEQQQEKQPSKIEGQAEVSLEEERKIDKIGDSQKLADNLKKQQYIPDTLTISKIKHIDDILHKDRYPDNEENSYTKPVIKIRGMKSNESEIPLENRNQIIDAINSLGKFEKIKIKGCTDKSLIDTNTSKEVNEKAFKDIREKYIHAGGSCDSYDKLLQSKEDPQNTVLGYRRAMEGVLSLNLTLDQMKKVEISNTLGTKENDPNERGFDVDVNYTEKIQKIIESETNDVFFKLLGELDLNNLGRYDKYPQGSGYGYQINNLGLKMNFDADHPTELYTRVMKNIPKVLADDTAMQEKIQNQIKGYLRSLIYTSGGEYNNGVWTSKGITNKQYYTIVAAHDKLLSSSEFISVIQDKDISVLENKHLELGKTLKQFLEENNDNPVKGVGNEGGGYRYYVIDGNRKSPLERKISRNDYILLGLYFQTKNS